MSDFEGSEEYPAVDIRPDPETEDWLRIARKIRHDAMVVDECYWCGEQFEASNQEELNNKFLEHGEKIHQTELKNAAARRDREKLPQDLAVKIIREGPGSD
jgi:hypothetical protein